MTEVLQSERSIAFFNQATLTTDSNYLFFGGVQLYRLSKPKNSRVEDWLNGLKYCLARHFSKKKKYGYGKTR